MEPDPLEMYLAAVAAERAVMKGQSVNYNGTQVTFANLADIREAQQFWKGEAIKDADPKVNMLFAVADLTETT